MKIDPATIPPRMKHLPRDRRGYPVPVIVLRDKNGDPHFTVNDTLISSKAIQFEQCGICGGKLGSHKWFVGGPGAAFHPKGRYLDGPLHRECGTFALATCPYLALAGSYSRRIDARTVKPGTLPDHTVLKDPTAHPHQPAVFVFGDTGGYDYNPETFRIEPHRPWRAVEFWRDGVKIDAATARDLIANDPTAAVPIDQLTLWQDRL